MVAEVMRTHTHTHKVLGAWAGPRNRLRQLAGRVSRGWSVLQRLQCTSALWRSRNSKLQAELRWHGMEGWLQSNLVRESGWVSSACGEGFTIQSTAHKRLKCVGDVWWENI